MTGSINFGTSFNRIMGLVGAAPATASIQQSAAANAAPQAPAAQNPTSATPMTSSADAACRIKVTPLNADQFFGAAPSGIMAPLFPATKAAPNTSGMGGATGIAKFLTGAAGTKTASGTNGVIFPYTPTITFTQDVEYQPSSMVHTNTDYYAYQRTPSVSLTITGKFTIQNQADGAYALAAIHFFRSASKMYFGTEAKEKAGLPPPILVLNGYGTYMFNNLKCILKSHSYTYDAQMDTVSVSAGGGITRLPVLFDLSITLIVQQTPLMMRTVFDLDKFRTGELMKGGGWI